MSLHRICLIINPASGLDLPVLAVLNRALKKYQIEAEIHVTQKKGEAILLAQQALTQNFDALAVYGGDGTVMEVSQALCYQPLPLLILAGGTANVLAKELKLPTDLQAIADFLGKADFTSNVVDMAQCNQVPFLLRLNTGLLAQMVLDTSRAQKDQLGTLAYPLSALKNLEGLQPVTYQLEMGGKIQAVEGVALMIANVGNIGLSGVSLLAEISPTDGKLDVIVLKSADMASLIALATSTVTPMAPPTTLQHWAVEKIKVTLPDNYPALLDDQKFDQTQLDISILPKAITLLS